MILILKLKVDKPLKTHKKGCRRDGEFFAKISIIILRIKKILILKLKVDKPLKTHKKGCRRDGEFFAKISIIILRIKKILILKLKVDKPLKTQIKGSRRDGFRGYLFCFRYQIAPLIIFTFTITFPPMLD